MADRLNLTKATISRYETGLSIPPKEILLRYASLAGLSLDNLLHESSSNNLQHNETPHLLNTDLLRQVIAGIEIGLAHRGITLPLEKKVELISLLYEYAVKSQEAPTPQTVERYLRLVA